MNNIKHQAKMDSLRGSSIRIGTIQRRLAWPPRKDDTHKSRSVKYQAKIESDGMAEQKSYDKYACWCEEKHW